MSSYTKPTESEKAPQKHLIRVCQVENNKLQVNLPHYFESVIFKTTSQYHPLSIQVLHKQFRGVGGLGLRLFCLCMGEGGLQEIWKTCLCKT